MATLFVLQGADEGKRFDLNAPVAGIGRDSSNLVRLHDTEVSRRHAEVREVDGIHRITDHGSSNGTYVNKQVVSEATLHTGDHVQVGQTILVFTAGPETTVSTDLASKINMISKGDIQVPAAIVKSISEGEGSRLLTQPHAASGDWLRSALANLSVLYQTTHAISHILDTDQLLERIMDLLFESIKADRGCIMLRNHDTNQFEPKAVRYRAGVDSQEKIVISRTIMDYVLREGQGVLVSDAFHDERFGPAPSIVRMSIREALCVPMKGRHETLGVLYLDTCTSPQKLLHQGKATGILTEDHLMLAIAIGHQAALALEETRYYQAMVHAERLAAVGQTIAAISHHVKNILQGLRTGSDLLKMGMDQKNDQMQLQGWRVVERNHSRIFNLVMDMLSYSKDREPALEPTDVNAVVRDVLELLEGTLQERSIRVQSRLTDAIPIVQADGEGLHRSLLNVITNAIDALEGRPNPTISITTMSEGDGLWVRVIVTDNGIGIPAEKMEDIFKPFVSSKGSKGTGLGLAVSRKIMREHGGDILVQSQHGKGSRFILRLPIHSPFQGDANAALQRTVVPEDNLGEKAES